MCAVSICSCFLWKDSSDCAVQEVASLFRHQDHPVSHTEPDETVRRHKFLPAMANKRTASLLTSESFRSGKSRCQSEVTASGCKEGAGRKREGKNALDCSERHFTYRKATYKTEDTWQSDGTETRAVCFTSILQSRSCLDCAC